MTPQLLLHGEDGPSVAPAVQADFRNQPSEAIDLGFPCSLRGGCALAPVGVQCVVCLAFVAKR